MSDLREAIATGMTAAEAATELGLTRSRISQLVQDGKLDVVYREPFGGREGFRLWVSRASVAALKAKKESA